MAEKGDTKWFGGKPTRKLDCYEDKGIGGCAISKCILKKWDCMT
jgi:hypothetical protein